MDSSESATTAAPTCSAVSAGSNGSVHSVRIPRRRVLHLVLEGEVLPTVVMLRAADLEWFNSDAEPLQTELVDLLQRNVPRLLQKFISARATQKRNARKRENGGMVIRGKKLRGTCTFEEVTNHQSVLLLGGSQSYKMLKLELTVVVSPVATEHGIVESLEHPGKKQRRARVEEG